MTKKEMYKLLNIWVNDKRGIPWKPIDFTVEITPRCISFNPVEKSFKDTPWVGEVEKCISGAKQFLWWYIEYTKGRKEK